MSRKPTSRLTECTVSVTDCAPVSRLALLPVERCAGLQQRQNQQEQAGYLSNLYDWSKLHVLDTSLKVGNEPVPRLQTRPPGH